LSSTVEKAQIILIVDPETDFLEWAQHQLETHNTRVLIATASDEAFNVGLNSKCARQVAHY
jgi:two-component system nitrogen regulation response regulator GlnG